MSASDAGSTNGLSPCRLLMTKLMTSSRSRRIYEGTSNIQLLGIGTFAGNSPLRGR